MSRPPPTATSELPPIGGPSSIDLDSINKVYGACAPLYDGTFGRLTQPYPVSYTHLTLPTNREV